MIRPIVQTLLQQTGIDLSNGAGISELVRFQENFRDYELNVNRGLGCEDKIFEGQTESSKHINLLYYDVDRHYHEFANLTGAVARRYACKACNKACERDITHVCDQNCNDLWRALRAPSSKFVSPG